jgi:hypothetical protein
VIDFIEFLQRRVASSDFVVIKMDVEGEEWNLLPRLLQTGTAPLIDELFVECHHRETPSLPGLRHSWNDCLSLFRNLSAAGVWMHEWF